MTIMDLIAKTKSFRTPLVVGTFLFLLGSLVLGTLILGDVFRKTPDSHQQAQDPQSTTTSTMAARHLDGLMVEKGQEALRPIAVMVENHSDARPWSGLATASVVIEAPVEGGITRFMAIFDPSSTSTNEIGPIRSARPYYVDWAAGFKASYIHVGGSPAALDKIATFATSTLFDLNEFFNGPTFWRDQKRFAPHNVYSSIEKLQATISRKNASTTQAVKAWAFEDEATTTNRGESGIVASVPYGGSYNASWSYDKETNSYTRQQLGVKALTRDRETVEVKNVIVMLTEQKILDDVGRLELRTIGSGDATLYRNGKSYLVRWNRSPGEPLKFEGRDGAAVTLNRGSTWISVTTDSRIYAGLGVN